MSTALFANRKIALGFAGATIVFAVIASVGLGAFAPRPEVGRYDEVETEDSARESSASRSSEELSESSGWADGGFSDDWGATSVAAEDRESADPDDDDSDSEFGEYEPATQAPRTFTPSANPPDPDSSEVVRNGSISAPRKKGPTLEGIERGVDPFED